MAKVLLLITSNYPFGGVTEEAFVSPELSALASKFDKVIIVPREKLCESKFNTIDLRNVTIDDSYATMTKGQPKLKRVFYLVRNLLDNRFFYSMFSDCRVLFSLHKLMTHCGDFYQAKKFSNWFKRNYLPTDDEIMIYSFWFLCEPVGYALLSDKTRSNVKCVARAHGYDLYDERVAYRSRYLRRKALDRMKALFAVSRNGVDYLKNQFPDYSMKIKLSYMGSMKLRDGLNPLESGEEIVLFSCARLHPVKRIPLMAECVKAFAESMPQYKFRWIHVGGGEDEGRVTSIIGDCQIDNLVVELMGERSNQFVHDLYVSRHIDFTMLTSESEGGAPIALCESMCYGVPVIATSVGGIPEIVVDGETGILLPADLTPDVFCKIVRPVVDKSCLYRENVCKEWQNRFCAERNRMVFADDLCNI